MNNKYFIFILAFILLLSFVSASGDLGLVKLGDTKNITQSCAGSTYSNISLISVNNNALNSSEISMTKTGPNTYLYSYTFTQLGSYYFLTHCDENGIDFPAPLSATVTPNGYANTIADAILYMLLLVISIVSMILFLNQMFKVTDYAWKLVYFNISYILLLVSSFILWSLCNNYLYQMTFISQSLYYIWLIVLVLLPIEIIVSFALLLESIMLDKKKQRLLNMGYSTTEVERHVRR